MLVTLSPADVLAVLRNRDRTEQVERDLPDVDPDGFDWPDDAPERHQLVASGVTSHVYDADDATLGHVAMAEHDDVDDPRTALDAAHQLPGLAVVLRSSPRNYHVVDLAVRSSFERALPAVDATPVSASYRDEMAEQGRFVLRDTPKYRRSGPVYKPAPRPVYVAPAGVESPLLDLSAPHLSVVRALAEDAGDDDLVDRLDDVAAEWRTVGETTTRSTYDSMTDELSEVLSDG